jgi:L-lactate permease
MSWTQVTDPLQNIILATSGTPILISAIISVAIIGMIFGDGLNIFVETIKQLKFTMVWFL